MHAIYGSCDDVAEQRARRPEYQAELEALGRGAVRAVSVEELEVELARKWALRAPDEPR
jgi:hypothetical protein